MSQVVTPDAVGWITEVGALALAALASGFHSAAVVDRLVGRRLWALRLPLGASAALLCAVLTPLAYIPAGDWGAAVSEAAARILTGGRGVPRSAVVDLFAGAAAGLSAYVAALALVLLPTVPALIAWRRLGGGRALAPAGSRSAAAVSGPGQPAG